MVCLKTIFARPRFKQKTETLKWETKKRQRKKCGMVKSPTKTT
jgi:hypothetical protein